MSRRCIVCHSPDIIEVVRDNKRYFNCPKCNKLHERALDTNLGGDIVIRTNDGIKHVIVGAYIPSGNQFLLLKRRAYPFGYAFPAGHVEYQEEPLETLKREVLEETGLAIKKPELLFHGEVDNKCRYGADHHIWYFYQCEYAPGAPILNAESESIGWYTLAEAQKLDLIYSAQYMIKHVISKL